MWTHSMNDSVSIYSYLQCAIRRQIKHPSCPVAHKQQNGFYLLEKKNNNKWGNLTFHLGLNLFMLPGGGLVSNLRGAPAIPRLSLETSREKCAAEWKSQHSQPSQIAIESIYSTLGKTRNQALIMRERESVTWAMFAGKYKASESTLVFIYPFSGVGHQLWPLCCRCSASDLMAVTRQVWRDFRCSSTERIRTMFQYVYLEHAICCREGLRVKHRGNRRVASMKQLS